MASTRGVVTPSTETLLSILSPCVSGELGLLGDTSSSRLGDVVDEVTLWLDDATVSRLCSRSSCLSPVLSAVTWCRGASCPGNRADVMRMYTIANNKTNTNWQKLNDHKTVAGLCSNRCKLELTCGVIYICSSTSTFLAVITRARRDPDLATLKRTRDVVESVHSLRNSYYNYVV